MNFSHKLKRFCKHVKPNVTAVPRGLNSAIKIQTTTHKKKEKKIMEKVGKQNFGIWHKKRGAKFA